MKPLAKLSLTRQRLYRKSCIKDNDIPFQETIVPVDLYEDHQGGMYCKLLWRILDFLYTVRKKLCQKLGVSLEIIWNKYVKPLRYVSKYSA